MMKFAALTPDENLITTDITSLTVVQKAGGFQILTNHAPMITAVKDFVVTVKTNDAGETYVVGTTGTLKVYENNLTLFLDQGVQHESLEVATKTLAENIEKMNSKTYDSSDDAVANLEIELMKRMKEMSNSR